MNKKWIYILLALVIVAVLVILIFQPFSLKSGTPSISLPTPQGGEAVGNPNSSLEVTADTVQTALRTLDRQSDFSHAYTSTTYYGDKGVEQQVAYSKKDDKQRLTQTTGSEVKNTLYADGMVYVWYDNSAEVFSSKLDNLSVTDADRLARLITYEELLNLPTGDITDAKYVTENNISCIYVKYNGDFGYTYELYIAVDSGLLISAEVFDGESPVYALETVSVASAPATDDMFTPPAT